MNKTLWDFIAHNWTVSTILSGSLLGIGFVIPHLWWLAIVGIVLLLQAAISIEKTWVACGVVFGAWCIKSAFSLLWFWSAYPIDWLTIPSPSAQLIAIGFYWVTSCVWLGSGGFFFAVTVRYVFGKLAHRKLLVCCLVPLIWLIGEVVSAGVFSVFTLGQGSFIQTYFSFGQVGYLFAMTSLGLFSAAVWGVYGLTIAVVSFASLCWYLVITHQPRLLIGLLVSGIFLTSVFSSTYQPHYQSQNITIQSINTQFSSEIFKLLSGQDQKISLLEEALTKALAEPSDYILLPEDSRYFSSTFGSVSAVTLASQFEFTHGSSSAVILDSSRLDLPTRQTVLRAQIYDGRTKQVYQFDKQYLVPQGEYVPYLYGSIMTVLGYGEAVKAIALDSSYTPGPLQQTDSLPEYIPGVLFCFESVSPGGVALLKANRSLPFIAHPISHSWFHSSTLLWHQLDVMLAVQSRQNNVPIVSAGNMVDGKLYLPTGEIITGVVTVSHPYYNITKFTF